MFDYAGCIHFHSDYSYDARTPIHEIVQSALRAGLDYAVVTDHFRLDARADGWERYHEANGRRMLLLVAEEISPRYNHYLAFGLKTPVVTAKTGTNAQQVIDAVNAQGGFGFIAHPDHEGAPLLGSRAFPWIDEDARGFAGLSVWDLMSDWASSVTSPWRALYAALRPASVLRGPNPKTLERWDRLAQSGHVVAIGEIDNHGGVKNVFGLRRRLFDFDFAFRTIRTHIVSRSALTGDADVDGPSILSLLKQGQSYVAMDLWGSPKGFQVEAFDSRDRAWMGGTLIRSGPALIEAKVPGDGRVRLFRDGQLIHEERKRAHLERDLDVPGVYRVEVQRHVRRLWRPWIFSNPIWVR